MKWYRKMKIVIVAMCMTVLLLSGCGNKSALETKNEAATEAVNTNEQNTEPESEEESMTIKVNETEYEVVLDQNETVKNIVENMPLTLDMPRSQD